MTCSARDSLQEFAYLELEHMDVEAEPWVGVDNHIPISLGVPDPDCNNLIFGLPGVEFEGLFMTPDPSGQLETCELFTNALDLRFKLPAC